MMIWVNKNNEFLMEPPEDDGEEWTLLASKEYHYAEIASLLDKQASIYFKQENYRAYTVAKDLAKELRLLTTQNKMVN